MLIFVWNNVNADSDSDYALKLNLMWKHDLAILDLQPKHKKKKSAAALNAEMRKPAWEDPDDEDNTQK